MPSTVFYCSLLFLLFVGTSMSQTLTTGRERLLLWNEHALQLIRSNRLVFFQGAKVNAVHHSAVYRALRELKCYKGNSPNCDHETADLAVTLASQFVLSTFFPNDFGTIKTWVKPEWRAVTNDNKQEKANDIATESAQVALRRVYDGMNNFIDYIPPVGDDKFRPIPPSFFQDNVAQVANLSLYALPSVDFNPPNRYPSVTSQEFLYSWNETRVVGDAAWPDRSQEQFNRVFFWAVDQGTVGDAGLYTRAVADIARKNNYDLYKSSTLFKVMTAARYDALGVNIYWKHVLSPVRPITVYHDGMPTLNPALPTYPTWAPLITFGPPNPEFPCGHCTGASTFANIMKLLLNTNDQQFSIFTEQVSPPITDLVRNFTHFDDLREDVSYSRILGGVHFRFSKNAGEKQGKEIAEEVFDRMCKNRKCITDNKEISKQFD